VHDAVGDGGESGRTGGEREKADDLRLPPGFCGLCRAVLSTVDVELDAAVTATATVAAFR